MKKSSADPAIRKARSDASSAEPDRLICADGLSVARSLPDAWADLVYLDPPFGVGRTHAPLRGRGDRFGLDDEAAYEDPRPRGDSLSPWLQQVLHECRRLLRPGGVLFLHLDWRSAHRARLFLDELFGGENFLNEIIWHYATGGIPSRWFARKHDTILFYRNGEGHTFHRLREKKYLAHRMSRRGVEEYQDARGWYRFRSLDDVWEIPWLTQDAKERTGYPTQKPLALLERILLAASDPGDRVLDLCSGAGTSAVAARALGRRWIAADRSKAALQVSRRRLESMDGTELAPFQIEVWPEERDSMSGGRQTPATPLRLPASEA